MKTKSALLPLSLPLTLALAACGSGGGNSAPPAITADPAVINTPNSALPAPQYLSPDVTNVIVVGSSDIYNFHTNYGTVSRYSGIGTSGEMIYGQAASGSRATTYYRFDNAQAFVERVGVTTFPDGATPQYTGDYAAIIANSAGVPQAFITAGTATLTADFTAMTLSGTITGRQDQAGGTYADVTLAEAAIVNGGFTGTATGGAKLAATPDFTDRGSYQGMVTGADAGEVVGTVYLRHLSIDVDNENGVFVTTEVTPP